MMSREILQELLTDACSAPSGDNVQPWRFSWNRGILDVFNIPDIHNPYLDYEERGAYIAHGALLENLCIAAPHYGWRAAVELFPKKENGNHVARILFYEVEQTTDHLYPMMALRATNRHSFKNRPPTEEEVRMLRSSVESFKTVECKLVTSREDMKRLGYAASRVEVVLLGNEAMAEHFFSGVIWTEKEERKKKAGFFVKTLEFNPVQTFMFWLMSKRIPRHLLRKLRFQNFIANQDAALYSSGSVMGGILIQDEKPEAFIEAGRALERIWLTAVLLRFGFQPLVGMTFVAYRLETGRGMLQDSHVALMRQALKDTRSILRGEGKIPVILFHTGDAPAPSVRTSRRSPNFSFT